MIRWYDYIIALIAADIILAAIIFGFTSDAFWQGLVGGSIAGFTYRLWSDLYCDFRKKQEHGE